jgi:hypothetical protein
VPCRAAARRRVPRLRRVRLGIRAARQQMVAPFPRLRAPREPWNSSPPRVLPRPAPAPRHVAVDPAVASMCACRLKTGPLLLPRRTDPPPLFHARRRPPWGLLGECRFPLHSVAVPATLHLPETPWKLAPLPECTPASPEFPATAASAGHRRLAASPAFPPPKSRRPSAPR